MLEISDKLERANFPTSTSTNLFTNPPHLDNWVERKEEIETIKEWLNNPQVTTIGITQANTLGIQGLGGVGKSALAAYLYHSLDFEAKFWADVSLKPDFIVFAEQAVKALGGKVSYPIDATQLIHNLLGLLSQRRCLLVIDNLETLLNNNRKWQDENYQQFFSCWQQQGTNSTLLITTQDKPESFQGLQQWYLLGGMKIAEGVSLLNKLAIQGTTKELEAFVEYVNGHPLTIKLVAGYLNEYCDRKLSQVKILGLEQFELAYQEAEGLHRSKQDARLSWIIQQHLARLNLEQQVFLTNLSVYRLPFNWEGASYMWTEAEEKPFIIQKKLQEFCNRSLLVKTEDNKFQFESLVQKFILQQTQDLTNAHKKAIEYYKTNLKDESSWQVLEDVAEYLEIFDHYCELKQYLKACEESLYFCYMFLSRQAYFNVLKQIYQKLVLEWKVSLTSDKYFYYIWALNNLGNICKIQGKYNIAIDYFQKSLLIAQNAKNLESEADTLNNLATVYDCLGNYRKSIAYYLEALSIAEQINDIAGISACLNNLGNAHYSLGNYSEAIDLHLEALDMAEIKESLNEQALCLNNLGNTYYSLADYHQSNDYHLRALEIVTSENNVNEQGIILNNIGRNYLFLGENKLALEYLQNSLAITKEIGNKQMESLSLMNLGLLYISEKKSQLAIDYLKQALIIQRQIGDLSSQSSSLNNLGIAYTQIEEYGNAIEYFSQSLKISNKLGNLDLQGLALMNIGNLHNYEGKYKIAIDYLQQALTIQQQIGDRRGEATSLSYLGNSREGLHQKNKARQAYEKAKVIYKEIKLYRGEKC
ncbi:MAG: tetratricopeptide repeat protein [Cyanobacteria bacterium P01_A01_bin.40]